MKKQIETLDEYLDQLDEVKEKIAERTKHMDTQQLLKYFAGARQRLERATGKKLRLRKDTRKRTRSVR